MCGESGVTPELSCNRMASGFLVIPSQGKGTAMSRVGVPPVWSESDCQQSRKNFVRGCIPGEYARLSFLFFYV